MKIDRLERLEEDLFLVSMARLSEELRRKRYQQIARQALALQKTIPADDDTLVAHRLETLLLKVHVRHAMLS